MDYDVELTKIIMEIGDKDIVEKLYSKEKLSFPIMMTESVANQGIDVLELSVRSYNCLKRAGCNTIYDILNTIKEDGIDGIKKLRNCGNKSVKEIVQGIFIYQYCVLPESKKKVFLQKFVQQNIT